jgi:ADP-heptose:LPS heptosyltransferase
VDDVVNIHRDILRSLGPVRRLAAEVALLRHLRSISPDVVVCSFPDDRFLLAGRITGATVRVGQLRQPLRLLLTHRPDIQRSDQGVLNYYGDLVRAIGAELHSAATEYSVPPGCREWVRETLQKEGIGDGDRVVVIHPGATGEYKIWPPDRYGVLAETLGKDAGVRPVICCGAGDEDIVRLVRDHAHGAAPVIRTDTDIGLLGALLERAALCLSNDSGPRHLAKAVGTPTLALFRHHHDREWMAYPPSDQCVVLQGRGNCPVCPAGRCLDRTPPGERWGSYCLRFLTMEEVITQARDMLIVAPSRHR